MLLRAMSKMTFIKEESLRTSKGMGLGALGAEFLKDPMLSKDLSRVFSLRIVLKDFFLPVFSLMTFLKQFP